MKVARGNRKKTLFFMIFKVLFLQQFSSNLYMLYTKKFDGAVHNGLLFCKNQQMFKQKNTFFDGVFWVYSTRYPKHIFHGIDTLLKMCGIHKNKRLFWCIICTGFMKIVGDTVLWKSWKNRVYFVFFLATFIDS